MNLVIVRNQVNKSKFDIISTDNISYTVEYNLLSYEDAVTIIETYNQHKGNNK